MSTASIMVRLDARRWTIVGARDEWRRGDMGDRVGLVREALFDETRIRGFRPIDGDGKPCGPEEWYAIPLPGSVNDRGGRRGPYPTRASAALSVTGAR